MNYEKFTKELIAQLEHSIPNYCTIKLTKVLKNNNVSYEGINIFRDGTSFSPNIYLNPYYEAYQNGMKMDEIATDILETFQNHKDDLAVPIPNFLSFQKDFEGKIFYRLINAEKNDALLENVPHILFLDLAVTFHLLVIEESTGIGSIRITNDLQRKWNLTLKQLHSFAKKNTPKLFPESFQTMNHVLRKMLEKDLKNLLWLAEQENEDDSSILTEPAYNMEEQLQHFLPKSKAEKMMYILSNTSGINGSTSLLYPGCLKRISKKLNGDFYVIPSSVHEAIIVPCNLAPTRETLLEMVHEVNCTQVPEEDVLSDQVYYYDSGANELLL